MSVLVVLDPGHGGMDAGAVWGGRMEKQDNLTLGLRVRALLQERGVTVLMTRVEDDTLSLERRCALANGAGADLFVSLHRGSAASGADHGVEVWAHHRDGPRELAMACELLERIAGVWVQSNRGVRRGDYQVLRDTAMPALLVKLGFISNSLDNALLDDYLEDYAWAIAGGICAGLGLPEEEPSPPPARYRVQVGRFAGEASARAFLETVRGMGLEAYMVAAGSL